jgi:hypothetical protein
VSNLSVTSTLAKYYQARLVAYTYYRTLSGFNKLA